VYNPRGGGRKLFKYDRVFGPESTQEQVYEDTKALIRSVLDGARLCQTLNLSVGAGVWPGASK
jgi:kinesin family protein C2/C3